MSEPYTATWELDDSLAHTIEATTQTLEGDLYRARVHTDDGDMEAAVRCLREYRDQLDALVTLAETLETKAVAGPEEVDE